MSEPAPRKEPLLSLKAKEAIAKAVITDAYEVYSRPAIVWSAGKDSTVALHLVKTVTEALGKKIPPSFFLDHGDHFPETLKMLDDVSRDWGLKLIAAKNDDVLGNIREGKVNVTDLNQENQAEIERTGFTGTEFVASMDTELGNHLLKTVPMNAVIKRYRFDALITGVRWDENPARSGEIFISPRKDHVRVQPILPFTERNIWEYIFRYKLPFHPKYREGFRSIDGMHDSHKVSDLPAWEQDMDKTGERAGRSQDKEEIMAKLRALGYM